MNRTALLFPLLVLTVCPPVRAAQKESAPMARRSLPGTQPLRLQGDLTMRMVAGIRDHLLARTKESVAAREKLWARDFSSHEAHAKSVEPNRESLRRCIGAVDERVKSPTMQLLATPQAPAMVAEGAGYTVAAV
ncbi:hypothetical protein HQ576_11630, partial [bacterium]|nr:hypothetical protein [bacterium]